MKRERECDHRKLIYKWTTTEDGRSTHYGDCKVCDESLPIDDKYEVVTGTLWRLKQKHWEEQGRDF